MSLEKLRYVDLILDYSGTWPWHRKCYSLGAIARLADCVPSRLCQVPPAITLKVPFTKVQGLLVRHH